MMRPFMLQPSGRDETANWEEEFVKINEKAAENQGHPGHHKIKKGRKAFRRFKRRVTSD